MDNWITVFKAGDYEEKGNWTPEKLDQVASNYDTSFHEAPLVIGHPKNDAPAYGWIEGVRRVGHLLQVKVKKVADAFKQLWDDKKFNKLSASFYFDLNGKGPYLRHVGALGAAVPEVKGLPAAAFAADDTGKISEFETEINYSEEIKTEGENAMSKEKEIKKIEEMVTNAVAAFGESMKASIADQMKQLKDKFDKRLSELVPAGAQFSEGGKKKEGYSKYADMAEDEKRRAAGYYEKHREEFRRGGISKEQFLKYRHSYNIDFSEEEDNIGAQVAEKVEFSEADAIAFYNKNWRYFDSRGISKESVIKNREFFKDGIKDDDNQGKVEFSEQEAGEYWETHLQESGITKESFVKNRKNYNMDMFPH